MNIYLDENIDIVTLHLQSFGKFYHNRYTLELFNRFFCHYQDKGEGKKCQKSWVKKYLRYIHEPWQLIIFIYYISNKCLSIWKVIRMSVIYWNSLNLSDFEIQCGQMKILLKNYKKAIKIWPPSIWKGY